MSKTQARALLFVMFPALIIYHLTVLFKLHWLPVQFRIRFKILVITFKAIHGLTPKYITDLIGVKSTSRYISLRSNNELLLELPRERTKRTLGNRAFCAAAPRLWNSLPSRIRNSRTLNNFKNVLKTHLTHFNYDLNRIKILFICLFLTSQEFT